MILRERAKNISVGETEDFERERAKKDFKTKETEDFKREREVRWRERR